MIGGQFLVVRGLGGRYTSVRLNNVPLPSTDPDMPGVQMDLFPSSLLSSLTIEKTFRAELPANFAGGTMNMKQAFPESCVNGVILQALTPSPQDEWVSYREVARTGSDLMTGVDNCPHGYQLDESRAWLRGLLQERSLKSVRVLSRIGNKSIAHEPTVSVGFSGRHAEGTRLDLRVLGYWRVQVQRDHEKDSAKFNLKQVDGTSTLKEGETKRQARYLSRGIGTVKKIPSNSVVIDPDRQTSVLSGLSEQKMHRFE